MANIHFSAGADTYPWSGYEIQWTHPGYTLPKADDKGPIVLFAKYGVSHYTEAFFPSTGHVSGTAEVKNKYAKIKFIKDWVWHEPAIGQPCYEVHMGLINISIER